MCECRYPARRVVVVQVGRNLTALHGEQDLGDAHEARRGLCVTEVGLDGADQQGGSSVAEEDAVHGFHLLFVGKLAT